MKELVFLVIIIIFLISIACYHLSKYAECELEKKHILFKPSNYLKDKLPPFSDFYKIDEDPYQLNREKIKEILQETFQIICQNKVKTEIIILDEIDYKKKEIRPSHAAFSPYYNQAYVLDDKTSKQPICFGYLISHELGHSLHSIIVSEKKQDTEKLEIIANITSIMLIYILQYRLFNKRVFLSGRLQRYCEADQKFRTIKKELPFVEELWSNNNDKNNIDSLISISTEAKIILLWNFLKKMLIANI
jgi:hypothetical protein